MKEKSCSGHAVSRRGFLRETTAAAAAVPFLSSGCKDGLPTRTLGRTGIRTSVVASDELPEPFMYRIAADVGVNYWHKMGRWGNPDFFTKIDRDSFACDLTIDAVEEDAAVAEFERGLTKSGLSMIDGFKVHSVYRRPEEIREKSGIFRAFERLKKQGKTRFLMLSQHRNVVEMLEAAVESGVFDVIQIPIHPLVPHDYFSDRETFPSHTSGEYFSTIRRASEKGIGIMSMKTVAGGPKNWETIPGFREKVAPYVPEGSSLAAALIRWTLEVPGVSSFASSMKSVEMFRENLTAAGAKISNEERAAVERFRTAADRSICRMCGECERVCPDGAAVSDILRFAMYHDAYGEPERARLLYSSLPARSRVRRGDDLSRYERACPNGLPVARMLRRAGEMLG